MIEECFDFISVDSGGVIDHALGTACFHRFVLLFSLHYVYFFFGQLPTLLGLIFKTLLILKTNLAIVSLYRVDTRNLEALRLGLLFRNDLYATELGRHDTWRPIEEVVVDQKEGRHDVVLRLQRPKLCVFFMRENEVWQVLVVFDKLPVDNLLVRSYIF